MTTEHRPHKSIQEYLEEGAEITDYKRHETSDHYTVHVRNKAGEAFVYTNVTKVRSSADSRREMICISQSKSNLTENLLLLNSNTWRKTWEANVRIACYFRVKLYGSAKRCESKMDIASTRFAFLLAFCSELTAGEGETEINSGNPKKKGGKGEKENPFDRSE